MIGKYWCLRSIIAGLSSEARARPRQRPRCPPKLGPDCTVALADRDHFGGIILDYRDVRGPAGWGISQLLGDLRADMSFRSYQHYDFFGGDEYNGVAVPHLCTYRVTTAAYVA